MFIRSFCVVLVLVFVGTVFQVSRRVSDRFSCLVETKEAAKEF